MDICLRKNKLIYISENLDNVSDDQIYNIYNKVVESTHKKSNNCKNRADWLSYVEKYLRYVDDLTLTYVKDMIEEHINNDKFTIKKEAVVLDVLNKLLVGIGMNKIMKLTDFVEISRELLMSDTSKQIIMDNCEYLLQNGFTKYECMIYQKKVKALHFSILKAIIKQTGHILKAIHKRTKKNNIMHIYTVYTIIKKSE